MGAGVEGFFHEDSDGLGPCRQRALARPPFLDAGIPALGDDELLSHLRELAVRLDPPRHTSPHAHDFAHRAVLPLAVLMQDV